MNDVTAQTEESSEQSNPINAIVYQGMHRKTLLLWSTAFLVSAARAAADGTA